VILQGDVASPVNPPSGCRFRTRCPRARPHCAEEEPPLESFGAEHLAACFYPLD
jgi:peptide/nickel transport system ATP-binding protein